MFDYTKGVITYIQVGIERSKQEIVLPKGIVVAKSTTKDFQDAYGEPAAYKDWVIDIMQQKIINQVIMVFQ